jgi:hypothetical protein
VGAVVGDGSISVVGEASASLVIGTKVGVGKAVPNVPVGATTATSVDSVVEGVASLAPRTRRRRADPDIIPSLMNQTITNPNSAALSTVRSISQN